MSVTHNFTIEQGSDFKITFIYQDVNGSPIDISEGKIGFRYRGNTQTSVTELVRGEPDGFVRSGGFGEIIIQFPASTTRLFDFDNAIYDLDFESTTAAGVPSNIRIATGTFSILKKNFNSLLQQAGASDSSTSTPSNTISANDVSLDGDRCTSAVACLDLDIYSRVYNGNSIVIEDNSDVSGTISGVTSRQTMQKIEVAVNGLKHDSPQDLTFILEPPSGDMILLSSSNKISKYDPSTHTEGFSWVFSNTAPANTFLNNVEHNAACNIDDKTDIVKYGSNTLRSNFDQLLFVENHEITGSFNLYANDNDRIGSGTINNWNLVITYTGAI
tara:strand:- start:985 stop:1971 length:987 start_codon:yes stop_codon:yes gene_type:complete